MRALPTNVEEVARIIGRDKALFLVGALPRYERRNHGDGTVRYDIMAYVPTISRLKPDHALSKLLGYAVAGRLSKAFGGSLLRLESCREIYRSYRDRMVREFYAEGMRASEIAELFSITDRTVRTICCDIEKPSNKMLREPKASQSFADANGEKLRLSSKTRNKISKRVLPAAG
ncbi:hypothetical protein AB4Y36_10235 [Paraburkholderia sp. BR10936]|uniref:hypothetical protein n=1 Tax=Paraburkholderia sp. BR10936 TaxID=3236993 RepID=UPI0034D1B416